jgi:hypothetical protein
MHERVYPLMSFACFTLIVSQCDSHGTITALITEDLRDQFQTHISLPMVEVVQLPSSLNPR